MSQVYPAISPVGAVVTPGHPVQFSAVGLPSGVTVTSWASEDVIDSDTGIATNIDEYNNSDVEGAAFFSDGTFFTFSYGESDTDADYNPGTVIPPPPGSSSALSSVGFSNSLSLSIGL